MNAAPVSSQVTRRVMLSVALAVCLVGGCGRTTTVSCTPPTPNLDPFGGIGTTTCTKTETNAFGDWVKDTFNNGWVQVGGIFAAIGAIGAIDEAKKKAKKPKDPGP